MTDHMMNLRALVEKKEPRRGYSRVANIGR